MSEVTDNTAEGRYELTVDGTTAIAAYDLNDGVMTFTHTMVPPEIGGQGIGGRLIAGALANVRQRDLKIVPQCSFVAGYLDKHPEDRDLVA